LLPLTMMSVCVATTLHAASPQMRSVRPQGGQRGTEIEVTLSGERLGDAREILFYQPGIATTKLEVVDDAKVKATLQIAPDAPLGLYDLRLRTATGLSELRSFSVGALKEIAEVEPNNEFAKPQTIPMDATVNGVAGSEDVDYYVVEARKGERITAEVEGIRLGITFFDPYVAILDTRRFELSASDDAALVWQDAFASIVAPEDGAYVIQVRDSAYAGNNNCLYRLHVGHFPRPTATFPTGGKLGETVEVRWVGDVLGATSTPVTLPDRPLHDFGIVARDDRGIAPYPNKFRLSTFGNAIESEPNDDAATATPFAPPLALNGVIERAGDVDQFVFAARKGERYDVKVYARALRSPLDSVLTVGPRKGGTIGSNDDANGSPDSVLRFNAPDDGEFLIAIRDQLLKGGPDYTYRVEVSPIEPLLTLSVPNESLRAPGGHTVAVAVPKGNRQAILVNASRADFAGELAIDAEGLPDGVTLEADPMAASLASYPVLFHASAEAAVAGALSTFTGKPTDTKLNVPAQFQQTIELALGQNNNPVWTRTEDRFALAVTEEAPFSIEVVEPKAPLVRGGSMDLKVVARRRGDFKAPIAVALLWNPPGLSSSATVSIPEGQDEATIPISAGDAAELKTWRVVVNGTATAPGGPLTVSSQLARLTVAEKFVTFDFQAATVEQGKETDLAVKVTKLADFDGEAKVTLLGLPNKVATEPKTINKETGELIFHLTTDKTSPAGNHTTLVCRAVFLRDGEPIVHNLGTGRLRIDVPLPPKPNVAGAQPAAAPVAARPADKSEKPLSRLEQLRRERQQAVTGGEAEKK
jgi:hypothetical protein